MILIETFMNYQVTIYDMARVVRVLGPCLINKQYESKDKLFYFYSNFEKVD